MKMSIKKSLRIRRGDNSFAKAQKALHIIREMIKHGMKEKAIFWLYRMTEGMSLEEANLIVTNLELLIVKRKFISIN